MSTNSKITLAIIIIVVLILVVLGFWYYGSQGAANVVTPVATTTDSIVTPAPINQSPDINAPTDSSDAAIDGDLTAIDAQFKNLDSDTATVDQALKGQTETAVQ